MRITKVLIIATSLFLSAGPSHAILITVEYTGTYTGSWSGNYDPRDPSPNFNGPHSGNFDVSPFTLTFNFDTSLAQSGNFSSSQLTSPTNGFPEDFYPSLSVGIATLTLVGFGFGGNSFASDTAFKGGTSQYIADIEPVRGAGFLPLTTISISAGSPLIPSSILVPLKIDSGLTGGGIVNFGYSNTDLGGGMGELDLTPLTLDVSVSPITDAVPEPSTWAMLLIGFAAIGLAGYRTSRRAHLISAQRAIALSLLNLSNQYSQC
jgi:hypothetical protein